MAKDNSVYTGAMKELRDAQDTLKGRMPGQPAVAIPLEHILTFHGEDGSLRAVIQVEQVVYLVDEILRSVR